MLHPLPDEPYALALGEERLVGDDQTVRFGSVRYSTPPGHAGTRVWCRAAGEELVITARTGRGAAEIARHRLSVPGSPSDLRRALPGPPGRERAAPAPAEAADQAEAAFLAIGDGAQRWLAEAAASGAARIRSKMARVVELAAVVGADTVDAALGLAAIAGRFADGDLASIIDHLAAEREIGEVVIADEAHWVQPGTAGWARLGEQGGGTMTPRQSCDGAVPDRRGRRVHPPGAVRLLAASSPGAGRTAARIGAAALDAAQARRDQPSPTPPSLRREPRDRLRSTSPSNPGQLPVTGPAAPPLPAELDALVRRMRLPYLRKAAPDVLATARAQRWEAAEVLRVLLAEEVAGRDAATRRMRRKTAGFPSGKTFSSWRAGESSIPAATQDALATLEWIGRAENLVIAGPSGTGQVPSRRGPGPRRDRERPARRLVHPGDPHRRDRESQGRRVGRPDRHQDLPQRPHRGR